MATASAKDSFRAIQESLKRYQGKKALTYNRYLRVPELTRLQTPRSKPAHHDEMLFIVIHQSFELWFKLVLGELESALHYMREKEILIARHFLCRAVKIFESLREQFHILETMRPVDFLEFRDRLNPASGFQSVQFREVEFLAGLKDERYLQFFKGDSEAQSYLKRRLNGPDLRQALMELLKKKKLTLKSIYQNPEKHHSLYLLLETLADFDEGLSLFRDHHVRVVERLIGYREGTGGSSGVDYLRKTTTKKCFPELWEVRTNLEKRAVFQA